MQVVLSCLMTNHPNQYKNQLYRHTYRLWWCYHWGKQGSCLSQKSGAQVEQAWILVLCSCYYVSLIILVPQLESVTIPECLNYHHLKNYFLQEIYAKCPKHWNPCSEFCSLLHICWVFEILYDMLIISLSKFIFLATSLYLVPFTSFLTMFW